MSKKKEQQFEQEIFVYKKQSGAIANKLARTKKELAFKRAGLNVVASSAKTKLDKLHKAEEKLKALSYNERLNSETEKQKFFFFQFYDALRCCKKRVAKNDKIRVF